MLDYQKALEKAVQHFWRTRGKQKKRQGGNSGRKDAGNRGAVTGGKHADGFVKLIAAIVKDAASYRNPRYGKEAKNASWFLSAVQGMGSCCSIGQQPGCRR